MSDPVPPAASEREFAPEDLPPVQPPSAGFIVQLFVVPAIIVAAIIGVWALFGRVAADDQDWQRLTQELKSENKLRKWRAAHGLAQMMQADRQVGREGERLSENREVALALTELMETQLAQPRTNEDDIRNQMFLAGALGLSDVHEVVLPPLRKAVSPEYETEVREIALASIAKILGRMAETDAEIEQPETARALIAASADGRDLVRQLAAYGLGFLETPETQQRLRVMLSDPEPATRANAALALARQNDPSGIEVLVNFLETANETDGDQIGDAEGEQLEAARLQEYQVLKNALKAFVDLDKQLSDEQREKIDEQLASLAEDYREPRIRSEAERVRAVLNAG